MVSGNCLSGVVYHIIHTVICLDRFEWYWYYSKYSLVRNHVCVVQSFLISGFPYVGIRCSRGNEYCIAAVYNPETSCCDVLYQIGYFWDTAKGYVTPK